MSEKRDNTNHFGEDRDLEGLISQIESLPVYGRRAAYRECARTALLRYLKANNLATGEECLVSETDETTVEADGISYFFKINASTWSIKLPRQKESRSIIESDPGRIDDPSLFVMDLRKRAKVVLLNGEAIRRFLDAS